MPASRVQVLLWARDDRMDLTQVSLGMDFFSFPRGKKVNTRRQQERAGAEGAALLASRGAEASGPG